MRLEIIVQTLDFVFKVIAIQFMIVGMFYMNDSSKKKVEVKGN
jgi:hypothetical protein